MISPVPLLISLKRIKIYQFWITVDQFYLHRKFNLCIEMWLMRYLFSFSSLWKVQILPGLPWFAGKLCIEVTGAAKIAFISEELCIGCGICVKVCKPSQSFIDTPNSLQHTLDWYHLSFSCRNAHLKQFRSLIYPKI